MSKYLIVCEFLDSVAADGNKVTADLRFIQAHLQMFSRLDGSRIFKNRRITRDYLARLEVVQTAGECLGKWRISSALVHGSTMRTPNKKIYTFFRLDDW